MDLELGMFVHFGLNTFTNQQHGDGEKPPSKFNPTALDCEQWARVAKSMGATYAVFTARHEEGFCLWPTKATDYSIRGSAWKNGKGDVVREFVDACRKYGLKVGLYHSSSFDSHHRPRLPLPKGQRQAEVKSMGDEDFLRIQVAQLTELLTGYGPIDYLWFDHHKGDEFWEAIDAAVSRLQGDCLRFGPDVWISGGHTGVAPETLWCSVNTATGRISDRPTTISGEPLGQFFRVWETNTTGNGPWFWAGQSKSAVAPLPELIEIYYESVGRGANLLLNFAPDRSGLMPDEVVHRARQFGDEIRRRFARPVAETSGPGESLTLDLGGTVVIDHVVVMENLTGGQKIAEHCIEAMVDGRWQRIADGQTVGHKRISRVAPVAVSKVRFRCLKSIQGRPEIRRLAAYWAGK
jgi:alpha-L-fucosidase